jgi:LmbE family N-acetylglucosaminyl deacetylase
MCRWLLCLLTLALSTPSFARDAAELQLALRKLTVVGGALYVAAHPDDENTAMLAWLGNEKLVRAGYLSVTRGDGGQNLIGDETGPLLGLVRTQELLAARRIDGAEQMFTRAIDFGYSKSPEEALAIWGHDEVLADVVWAIRRFQPDVVVTRFPVTGEGGHGHHTASAKLAEEAFVAAGDPARFPEQLHYVAAWKPRRIFWNRFSWRPIDPNDPSLAGSLRVDLGAYNPLLGRAYTEIAAVSRSQHKSQGFGSAERRGTILNYLDPRGGDAATNDLFEGIDTSWARYAGGETVGSLLRSAADAFDPQEPAASIPLLLRALEALDRLRATPGWSDTERPWLQGKRRDLLDAVRDCAGLAIDVSATASTVVPGGQLPVSVSVVNRSSYPFRLASVASVFSAATQSPGAPLDDNHPVKVELMLAVPATQSGSQPYWLERPAAKGLYTVGDSRLIGRPDSLPELPIDVTLDDAEGNRLAYSLPAVFRWTDPVDGEQIRTVDVVPLVSVTLGSSVYLFPEAAARPVTVRMRSFGAANGALRLRLPTGWSAVPASVPVVFAAAGEEAQATFQVTAPEAETTGEIGAEVALGDGEGAFRLARGSVDIDYAHIPAQRVLRDATAKAVRADIRRRGERVGYIMGSGDDVPDTLRQVGYEVTLLSDVDLDRGDFSTYDAVVAGIRAYNTRTRLRLAHDKLMRYVEGGGTMVVQYNTTDTVVPAPGPRPFEISRDRVTVEEAPVRLLDRADPLLAAPNRITEADFEGWVQERGLYFPGKWDPAYRTVLATNDPGEGEKAGGQLTMRHGEGVFVYTAYAWWRQLPAGVPGAIRAFVNLVSAQ